MSSAERFRRHHKQQTDRAISQAYSRLGTGSLACATFAEVLGCVRNRAPQLLLAPVVGGQHPGIEAILNLSQFASAFVRPVAAWPGSEKAWRVAISSLAQYLVGKYSVPRFLAASWYATDECAERKREWFVVHARGASFRSLRLPVQMTRKMEHIFLSSRDHLGIEYAMRRAELLGLDAPVQLAEAVLATRQGTDLRNGDFWRTVWLFLIANARAIDRTQVGPIVDFVQAVRYEPVMVETPQGLVLRDPPQPSFSMKGRTVRSMLRRMKEWHRALGSANGAFTWEPSRLRPMTIEESGDDPSTPQVTWSLTELNSSAQLRTEGAALRHCVASYADRCWRGTSRIWSLRLQRAGKVRHVLTVEVDLSRRMIVQARGWGNRPASGKSLRLIQDWAMRESLRVGI